MNSFRPAQGGWVCDTAHIMKGAGTDDAKKELVERVAVVAAREADGRGRPSACAPADTSSSMHDLMGASQR